MKVVDNSKVDTSKLCHARPGEVVQVVDSMTPCGSEPFLVCVNAMSPGKPGRLGMMHGLYDEQRPLFLVSLATGESVPMPNLSSQVRIVRRAKVVLGPDRRHEDPEMLARAVQQLVDKWNADMPGIVAETQKARSDRHFKCMMAIGGISIESKEETEMQVTTEQTTWAPVRPVPDKVRINGVQYTKVQTAEEAHKDRMAYQNELDGLRLQLFEASEKLEATAERSVTNLAAYKEAVRMMTMVVTHLEKTVEDLSNLSPMEIKMRLQKWAGTLRSTWVK